MFIMRKYIYLGIVIIASAIHTMDNIPDPQKLSIRAINTDYTNAYGQNLLHSLICFPHNHPDLSIDMLIAAGIDINSKTRNGNTPLHLAISGRNEPALVKTLLGAGANTNIRSTFQNMPIHQAAQVNNVRIVNLLIAAGADVEVTDSQNRTVWDILAYHQHTTKQTIKEQFIKKHLLQGRRICACSSKDLGELLSTLVAHETKKFKTLCLADASSINNQDHHFSATLLMYAATLGSSDIVDFLLQHNANPFLLTKRGKSVFDLLNRLCTHPQIEPEEKMRYKKIMRQCKNQIYQSYIKPLQIAFLRKTQKSMPRDLIRNHFWPFMLMSITANSKIHSP